jgi:hypothetical protein
VCEHACLLLRAQQLSMRCCQCNMLMSHSTGPPTRVCAAVRAAAGGKRPQPISKVHVGEQVGKAAGAVVVKVNIGTPPRVEYVEGGAAFNRNVMDILCCNVEPAAGQARQSWAVGGRHARTQARGRQAGRQAGKQAGCLPCD